MVRLLAHLALLALLIPGLAPAQVTEKHPELGLSVVRPSRYEARAVPPGEQGLVLFYAPKNAPRDKRSPATLRVYQASFRGEAAVAVERWVLDTFRPRQLEAKRAVRERYGRKPHRFEGELVTDEGEVRALFVHAWSMNEDLIVVVGEGESKEARRDRRQWERFADSMRFDEVREDSAERTKWTRYYGQRRYSHPDARADVRAALVDGWEVRDTAHYMILFHGASDAPLLELAARQLEVLRDRFQRDFPPDGLVDQLPVVRICRDRGEYLTYGGESWTAGYFNANEGELVLYDARTDVSQPLAEDHPTLRTLYHEACHQYLFSTAGALPPHTWFDEGTAEYYAGSQFEGGRLVRIDPLEDRASWLAAEWRDDPGPPLEDLLALDQRAFYANAALHYSMAWSFVHFLRTSDDPTWSRALDRYFVELRRAWRSEVEELGRVGVTASTLERAREDARATALERAFAGIDLAELEEAWRGARPARR